MVSFMEHSVNLIEKLADDSNNFFHMGRKGYAFITADAQKAHHYHELANEWHQNLRHLNCSKKQVRVHNKKSGTAHVPSFISDTQYKHADGKNNHNDDGVDIIEGSDLIQQAFPFLSKDLHTVMHARRCGWISAQQLGMLMLERARETGQVQLLKAEIDGFEFNDSSSEKKQVTRVNLKNGNKINVSGAVVNCAGPYFKHLGNMLGLDLPVFNELHAKVIIPDVLNVVPRTAPMMIWSDKMKLEWTEEELQAIEEDPVMKRTLLGLLPTGLHFRPVGGSKSNQLMLLWEFAHMDVPTHGADQPAHMPMYPIDFKPFYAEMCLKGLTRMVPGFAQYLSFDKFSARDISVDGGYYCKTRENRLLVGPVDSASNVFLCGAASGYGIMASNAAGDLIADYLTEKPLPFYSKAFLLNRYQSDEYKNMFASVGKDHGQI